MGRRDGEGRVTHRVSPYHGRVTDTLGIYFDALYQITKRISSSLDLDHVLSYLAEEVATVMQGRAASVRLLNAEGELEVRAVYGLSEQYLSKGPVRLADSPFDREILEGRPVEVRNVAQSAAFQYPQAAQREGIVSVAGVPLIAHGKPIGVLRVYSGEERTFSDTALKFLQSVADVAALSIDNARHYGEVRTNYEETMNALWGQPPA